MYTGRSLWPHVGDRRPLLTGQAWRGRHTGRERRAILATHDRGASLTRTAMATACNRVPAGDGKMTIAVIPKGTSHVFWQSIHAGAEKAAQELGVHVIWRGPLREDDRASQVSEVEGFITRGVSGIVLAPLDDSALVVPVADATRAKIPVVIIDSALKSNDYISFVATDNRQGGRLAGEGLANLLPNGGKVVLIR